MSPFKLLQAPHSSCRLSPVHMVRLDQLGVMALGTTRSYLASHAFSFTRRYAARNLSRHERIADDHSESRSWQSFFRIAGAPAVGPRRLFLLVSPSAARTIAAQPVSWGGNRLRLLSFEPFPREPRRRRFLHWLWERPAGTPPATMQEFFASPPPNPLRRALVQHDQHGPMVGPRSELVEEIGRCYQCRDKCQGAAGT